MIYLLLTLLFPIQETIPSGPFSYPGKYEREIITFDPEDSPAFTTAYNTLLNRIDPSQGEEEILLTTLDYVQKELFNLSECTNGSILKMIAKDGRKNIPLDAFLEEKLGVCRHIALCVTLLIHGLTEDGILEGKTFLIREDLSWGRHAWTLFLSEGGAYHLDAYQGIFENGKTRAGFSNLCQKYGRDVMLRQSTRWNHDH